MIEITAEYITVIATGLAALSAAVSAVAAIKSNSTAKSALKFQRQLEKNQQQLMKNEVLLKNYQSLITTFAKIQAIAKDEWSQERLKSPEEMRKNLKSNCVIVRSLNQEVGSMIQQWENSIDDDGNSISRIIGMILDSLGARVGNKYDTFFSKKSNELNEIHEKIFQLMAQNKNQGEYNT